MARKRKDDVPKALKSTMLKRMLCIRRFEEEVKREAAPGHSSSYAKVTFQGHIAVQSMRTKPVVLRIIKSCSGTILSASGKPKMKQRIGYQTARNRRHLIVWEFELTGGEKKELTYAYEAIVHRS